MPKSHAIQEGFHPTDQVNQDQLLTGYFRTSPDTSTAHSPNTYEPTTTKCAGQSFKAPSTTPALTSRPTLPSHKQSTSDQGTAIAITR